MDSALQVANDPTSQHWSKAQDIIWDRSDGKQATTQINTGPNYTQVLSVQPVNGQISLPGGHTVPLPDWDMVDSPTAQLDAPAGTNNGQAPAREDV